MYRVRTLVESKDLADKIITEAIDTNIAVAGYVSEVLAIFRWQGGLKREVQYRIELSTANKDAVVNLLRLRHTYLVPDIYTVSTETETGMDLWSGATQITKVSDLEDM